MKKISVILITTVAVIGVGLLFMGSKDTTKAKVFTAGEVASHKTASDCWTIIHSDVYDVTKYIKLHPGGNEITRACGVDATVLFESKTTQAGQKIGKNASHSEAANAQLGQFKIGKIN